MVSLQNYFVSFPFQMQLYASEVLHAVNYLLKVAYRRYMATYRYEIWAIIQLLFSREKTHNAGHGEPQQQTNLITELLIFLYYIHTIQIRTVRPQLFSLGSFDSFLAGLGRNKGYGAWTTGGKSLVSQYIYSDNILWPFFSICQYYVPHNRYKVHGFFSPYIHNSSATSHKILCRFAHLLGLKYTFFVSSANYQAYFCSKL